MSERHLDPKELAADIRATRQELALTVSALVDETDPRRRAHKALVRGRLQAHDALARTHLRILSIIARIRTRNGFRAHKGSRQLWT